ncbi:MAG: hypothetical protein C9356_03810 [Oleiphilus sp.]|nr:MAG: hypothetical protein C9356_03810 [Oleiphilus sp.]
MQLNIYGTSACHLCADAEALVYNPTILGMLKRHGIEIIRIDVADDPADVERYGSRIPLVSIDGRKTCLDWPFSLLDLRAFLENELGPER